jgi:hypothetical protein
MPAQPRRRRCVRSRRTTARCGAPPGVRLRLGLCRPLGFGRLVVIVLRPHAHAPTPFWPSLAQCGCRERTIVAVGEASRRGVPGHPAGGQGCVAGHQFKRRDSLPKAIGQVVMPLAQHAFERRLLLRDPARVAVRKRADASRKAPTFSRTADGRSSFFTETGGLPRSAAMWRSSSGALRKSPPTSLALACQPSGAGQPSAAPRRSLQTSL